MRKNWQGGDDLIWKNGTLDGHAYKPSNSKAGFNVARGLWYFGDFCNFFLPNISEDQEKVLQSERGAMALYHMVNPALVIALRS